MAVVCGIETSYFRLLSKREKQSPSSLLPEQTVLLHSTKDHGDLGEFLTAAIPQSVQQPYFRLLPKQQSYWLLQEFPPSAQSPEWNLKLNALLRTCTSLNITRILFLQPSSVLQTDFARLGVEVILEYLAQAKEVCLHVTLLAPNPDFYRNVREHLGQKGLCSPHPQLTLSAEVLLAGYLAVAKCSACNRLAIDPVYADATTKCALCVEERGSSAGAEVEILKKLAVKVLVVCRCGQTTPALRLDHHTVTECPRKEWFCQKHRIAVPSGNQFLDHYLNEHFDEAYIALDRLIEANKP